VGEKKQHKAGEKEKKFRNVVKLGEIKLHDHINHKTEDQNDAQVVKRQVVFDLKSVRAL